MIIVALVCALPLKAADINVTKSPDGLKEAFTRDNDLWVRDVASGNETRLTFDGSEVILNGYASWVYYEEIFGRPSRYKAFWWSPDSKKIGYYRFDNSNVPMFPIYSPFGQDGSLSRTRYPKAGETNPSVRIAVVHLDGLKTVWADFPEDSEQYFGTPFWGPDSREFFVSREPRRQSVLDLYSVNASDGSKRAIYHEEYPTWVEWIEEVKFTDKGLYMARDFESGWQQIYFLSYDGDTFRKLTSGENWDISLLRVDEKKGDVWFTARRDSKLHPTLYKVDKRRNIVALTDPELWTRNVEISEDGKTFTAEVSDSNTPWKKVEGRVDKPGVLSVVSDTAEEVDLSDRPHVEKIVLQNDGFDLYGLISYPKGFDPAKKYPVLMTVYGGPGTAYVRDRWGDRDASNRWCWENGIIYMVVDPRSSGENGRRGMDQAFRQMTVIELQDYLAWARHMQAQPYVKADRIGVTGFSFGGTTTSMLVLRYPEQFCCGIAGGGVYDWHLYDSHYTERFMDTPQANPEGYDAACVLNYVADASHKGYLKLTHGTGDDNVHFQNTLQLIDALQKSCRRFDLMIYPDGMHGYRGYQGEHDRQDAQAFWTEHLLAE